MTDIERRITEANKQAVRENLAPEDIPDIVKFFGELDQLKEKGDLHALLIAARDNRYAVAVLEIINKRFYEILETEEGELFYDESE